MLYFGYGSNLHQGDLEAWCVAREHDASGIRPVGRAWLPDAEVVFHYLSRARRGGALSVRARRGSAVPGVLFEVSDTGWSALDAKEGAPRTYARVDTVALTEAGDEVPARTYVVTDRHRRDAHVPPSPHYLELVCAGLAAHALPDEHVRSAARSLATRPLVNALFTYGTLMHGELRHDVVGRHRPRVAAASVRGRLVDLGEYPGLVPGDARVHGELIELEDPGEALGELDAIEEFRGYGMAGSLYRRVLIEVREGSGAQRLAWAYRYLGAVDGARTIASGDWRRR